MTTFPVVIDALVSLLRERLPDYVVNDGMPPEYGSPFNQMFTDINIGWSPEADPAVSEITPEGLAGSGRESYSIRCTINAYNGVMAMKPVRDQSMAVFNECKSVIQGFKWNKEVPGVMRVYVGLVAYDAGLNKGAAISSVQFNVTVEGFADYGP